MTTRSYRFPSLAPLGVIAALTLGLAGCFGGDLGAACGGETDCGIGLRCFQPDGFGEGICTVRCDSDGSCEEGVCTATSRGSLCLSECTPGSCADPHRCSAPVGGGTPVCFGTDEMLGLVVGEGPVASGPGRIAIAGWLVEKDANEDGVLSAGEYATVHVFVQNPGVDDVERVWAAVDLPPDADYRMTACEAVRGSYCVDREPLHCSCESNSYSEYLDVPAGSTVNDAQVVTIDVEIDPGAEGVFAADLTFGSDETDARWSERLEIPLNPSGARLEPDGYAVIDDANQDGVISRGEWVELALPVMNTGATQALDVWGALELTEDQPITIRACKAGGSHCVDRTALACSCEQNSYSVFATVGPMERADNLVALDLEVADDALPGTHTVPVRFGDRLGQVWTGSIELVVGENAGRLEVASASPAAIPSGSATDVAILVTNAGSANIVGAWGGADVSAIPLEIDDCDAVGSSTCVDRSSDACSCESNSYSTSLDVAAGETTSSGLFTVRFDAPAGVTGTFPIAVQLGDAHGNVWTDTFTLEVTP